jgi:glutamate N-acetyltransferase/amino-acid N-acetyltransferase
MGLLETGIPAAARELGRSDEHLLSAATAIMTTDTVPKLFSVDVELSAGSIRVSGVCKGAAMIAPNMATMLGLVMTDAKLTADQCSQMLRRAVDQTFNCISVDGHMSTSDTVLMLAGGAAGFDPAVADLELISRAVTEVCRLLATSIIRDAEGADHFITIDVRGLASRGCIPHGEGDCQQPAGKDCDYRRRPQLGTNRIGWQVMQGSTSILPGYRCRSMALRFIAPALLCHSITLL